MKAKMNRLLALLLTLVTVAGLFPTSAFALEQGESSSVTDKYINEADGREIAATLTRKSTEVKSPQTIDGYVYQSFSEVIEHVYAKEDLTYIQGYGDGTHHPESTISRSEAVTLINRMRNRVITADELKALGVVNPYTDLVETYWAYGDLLEATVKHAAADWHDLTYYGGNLDTIVEEYVDTNGKEIAEPTISQGKVNYAARQKRVLKPASQSATPIAMARWDLPAPTLP